MARKPLESSIEKRLCEQLADAGAVVLKVGYDGYPDRLVLTGKGKHYWIEFKRPGGELRQAQRIRKRHLEAMGETVRVIGDK